MAENIRPYIVINGKSSREISGLLIVSLPPITKPQMRVTAEEIDGRDGDIVTELGFSAYDKPVEIGLAGDYDVNEVISYFNQAGIITFSNEPDKYYRFAQYNGIDFEKLIRFKTATVIFHVQPFKYDTDENDAVFWNPENISITNEGNIYSKPELAIQGSGNVGIALNGSEVLSLELGETQQAIIIDTDKMNAYGTKSNVKELITDINPVQSGTGTPSPQNVRPISGFSALNVTRTGKNLFKKGVSTSANGVTFTVNDDGSISLSGTATNTAFFIAFENVEMPYGTYTLSGGYSALIAIYIRGSSSGANILGSTGSPSSGVINTGVITGLIRIQSGTNTDGITLKPQLEVGNQATDYEPYNGQTATVNFGQTVYGGVADVTNGKVTITHGIVDLGNLNWASTTQNRFYSGGIASLAVVPSSSSTKIGLICSHYEEKTADETYLQNTGIALATNGNLLIYDSALVGKTAGQVKTALSGVMLVYELATPIEIQLTAEEIQTLIGTNNIWSNTGDISECIYTKAGADVTTSGAIVSFEVDASDLRDDILKNRLVRGNYDNLRLKAGANQIGITGDVDVLVLSNFSRWL